MTDNLLLLVAIAIGLGILLGKFWEQDRRGGTVDLEQLAEDLETELEAEQLHNAILRGELDARRASSMATHPSCRPLHLVTETPA